MTGPADELVTRAANGREAAAPVASPLLERWSPRAFHGDGLPEAHAQSLLEAMRWAPSCFNEQPWQVVWAHRDTPGFDRILGCLVPGNQQWAQRAALLMVIAARTRFRRNDESNRHAGFDSGAAWLALALQAERLGYRAHAMAGFDVDRAHEELGFPRDGVEPFAAVAVGRQAPATVLPESLREREAPSGREPVSWFARCLG